eukprot:CAMPEP_0113937316 /NCGR_PEP_ID=MMETSP1339-20121228/3967_1 /TAXON_ID=94617 /ORGANISM="Fibrocapsa japonica" /LENGTH=121 /DNA_ID=CAMNT_0000940035 /DNA_START=111 /DNA_END=473 /DNA_ORIENTATION=- /assembly_acc=CAM_ASM_000762
MYIVLNNLKYISDTDDIVSRAKAEQEPKDEAKVGLDSYQSQLNKDYYEILGVERLANSDKITRAYEELSRKANHDKISDGEGQNGGRRSRDLEEAYKVLTNNHLRAQFDRGENAFSRITPE